MTNTAADRVQPGSKHDPQTTVTPKFTERPIVHKKNSLA